LIANNLKLSASARLVTLKCVEPLKPVECQSSFAGDTGSPVTQCVDVTIKAYSVDIDVLNSSPFILPLPRSALAALYGAIPRPLLLLNPGFNVVHDAVLGPAVAVNTSTDLLHLGSTFDSSNSNSANAASPSARETVTALPDDDQLEIETFKPAARAKIAPPAQGSDPFTPLKLLLSVKGRKSLNKDYYDTATVLDLSRTKPADFLQRFAVDAQFDASRLPQGAADFLRNAVSIGTGAAEVLAPAQVVQRGGGIELERGPAAVGHESIEGGAFIHFVEMRQWTASVELLSGTIVHRGTVAVVEQAFDQIRCRHHILEALLVLNANRIAAEFVRKLQSGDVHLALLMNLLVGELRFVIFAGVEAHAFGIEPPSDSAGFVISDEAHPGDQRGLAEPFLEDTERIQQLIVDDGVVHAHAAFIEDAENRLVLEEPCRELFPGALRGCGKRARVKVAHVREIVGDASLPDPFLQARSEIFVSEVFAPQSVERDARLDQRAIQIEQPDQARPLAGPVGNGENGPAMAAHAGQHVMRVLPRGGGEDKAGVWIDASEDVHTHALIGDEPVALRRVYGKCTLYRDALFLKSFGELALQFFLSRPTDLICR